MSTTTTDTALDTITAVLSMLHERPNVNSATRRFRGQTVLSWTLSRLARASSIGSTAILCWEDQLEAVVPIAEQMEADILAKGPRMATPEIDSIAAARRWSDGWRGGLLGTCAFDLGFHAKWFEELADQLKSDAVVLIDPSSGLIDPGLVDGLIAHASEHTQVELCFMPAAPGLSGALIRRRLLQRLANSTTHPGRLLHYTPDTISREQLGGEWCAPVPTSVARTIHRFTLDSDRQLNRVADATVSLNGQLISSPAEDVVAKIHASDERIDALPRDIVLELNTDRATRPIYWPGKYQTVKRGNLDVSTASRLFAELADAADDVRLTIAGVGDPLLSKELFPIIAAARNAGIAAVHVETDLVEGDAATLAQCDVDVVSAHIPALTPEMYETIMGVDAYAKVLANVRTFVETRSRRGAGVPILAPTFVKCRENLGEMEPWYDQWLRAVGSAVITGPSDFAGQIPDAAVADMAPPKRRPCVRLSSRLTILSDGSVVSCEQDFAARHVLGNIRETPVQEIWQNRLEPLRSCHRSGRFSAQGLCGACREWHRP